MNDPGDTFVPITVTARRAMKGARQRNLARQLSPGDSIGIATYAPGGVSIHFVAEGERVCVFLPPNVVARIEAALRNRRASGVGPREQRAALEGGFSDEDAEAEEPR